MRGEISMNNEEKKALEEVLGKIFGTEVEIVEGDEEEVVVTEEQVEAQKIARAVLEKAGYKKIIIAACDEKTHFITTPEKARDTMHLLESIKDHAEEKLALEAFEGDDD